MRLTAALLLLCSSVVHAQDVQFARVDAPLSTRPPVLMVKSGKDKKSEPLALAKVDIDVAIVGQTAQTSMTMTFTNHLDRVMEGELVFPLPDGSSVSGYALDINGKLVDAVVVEKHEARIIFESEQRKGIDPGLVEWVKGNNFRTRIWPIPAKGSRTIRVRYNARLARVGDHLNYQLPLAFRAKIKDFKLAVRVAGNTDAKVVSGGEWIKSKQTEKGVLIQGQLENAKPDKDLAVSLKLETQKQVHLGKHIKGNHTYFVINDTPALPKFEHQPEPARRLAVYWDASKSRGASDIKRDFMLLEKLIQRFASSTVDVVVFRDRMDAVRSFPIDARKLKESTSAVIDHLRQIPYDGGTNLEALSIVKNFADQPGARLRGEVIDYDNAVLFTDGMGNLGGDMPAKIAMPVHVITSSGGANYPLLRHIASTSGGVYFNLGTTKDADVIGGIERPMFSFIKAEFDSKKVTEVFPNATEPVNGQFTIAGRLTAPEASVTLHYGFGGKTFVKVKHTLRQADVIPFEEAGNVVARQWAQKKVDSLVVFPEKNKEELIAVGRSFGLVTPGTSLLVLETIEQYLEYGIEPPRTRPNIRKQWVQRIEQREIKRQKTREEKIKQVLAMWQERDKWWSTSFKYPKGFVYKDRSPKKNAEARPGVTADADAAPAPPRTPAPRPTRITGMPPEEANAELTDSLSVGGRAGEDEGKAKGKKGGRANSIGIKLKPWDPKTPYVKAMDKAGIENAYAVYLDYRNQYADSPAFYLDCANYFFVKKKTELAVRVLTNVLELELEDPRLMRIVAHKLQQEGLTDLAINLFEKVRRLRPEEPQSHRDLGLALTQRADLLRRNAKGASESHQYHELIFNDYSRAIALLNQVVTGSWDGRFPGVEVIALNEANRNLALINAMPHPADWSPPIDSRLRKLMDVDIRILLTWDTDLTDIDLWVIEPSKEKCYYSHSRTTIGGFMTKDFTRGYGPEVYMLRKGMTGEYTIKANFYGSNQQTLTGGTTIQATIITNYGRPNEERKAITLRLKEKKEEVSIGTITFDGQP